MTVVSSRGFSCAMSQRAQASEDVPAAWTLDPHLQKIPGLLGGSGWHKDEEITLKGGWLLKYL